MTTHVPPVVAPIRRPAARRPQPRSTRTAHPSTVLAVVSLWVAAAAALARHVAAEAPGHDLVDLIYALGFPA